MSDETAMPMNYPHRAAIPRTIEETIRVEIDAHAADGLTPAKIRARLREAIRTSPISATQKASAMEELQRQLPEKGKAR